MPTKNPKDDTKSTETPAGADTSELADDQLQDASGGMIFVKIPSLGDDSIQTDGYDQGQSRDDEPTRKRS